MSARALPVDVRLLTWAADQLGIAPSTAYRLAATGQIPGAFKVGAQWRVSVPKFLREVHGDLADTSVPDASAEAATTRSGATVSVRRSSWPIAK